MYLLFLFCTRESKRAHSLNKIGKFVIISRMISDSKYVPYDYEAFRSALCERIKKLRIERGFTQHDIVRRSDFYESHWRRIESGKTMSLQTLIKVANIFEIKVVDLLEGIGEPTSTPAAKPEE